MNFRSLWQDQKAAVQQRCWLPPSRPAPPEASVAHAVLTRQAVSARGSPPRSTYPALTRVDVLIFSTQNILLTPWICPDPHCPSTPRPTCPPPPAPRLLSPRRELPFLPTCAPTGLPWSTSLLGSAMGPVGVGLPQPRTHHWGSGTVLQGTV